MTTTQTADIYDFDALEKNTQTMIQKYMEEIRKHHAVIVQDSVNHEVRDRKVCRQFQISYPDQHALPIDNPSTTSALKASATKHPAGLWKVLWPLTKQHRKKLLKTWDLNHSSSQASSMDVVKDHDEESLDFLVEGDELFDPLDIMDEEIDNEREDDNESHFSSFSKPSKSNRLKPRNRKIQNHRRHFITTGKPDIISQKITSPYANAVPISNFFKSKSQNSKLN